jgi:hypothetical protein
MAETAGTGDEKSREVNKRRSHPKVAVQRGRKKRRAVSSHIERGQEWAYRPEQALG